MRVAARQAGVLALGWLVCAAHADVTVLEIHKDPGARAADLAAGDRVLAVAAAGDAPTPIDHPMDLEALAFGRGRIGAVRLTLADGDSAREIALPVGAPMPRTTVLDPAIVAEADAALQRALDEAGAEAAVAEWSAVIGLEHSPRTACWAGLHRVRQLVAYGAIDVAIEEAGGLGEACAEAPNRDAVVARAAAAEALRERARDTDAVVELLNAARTEAESLDPLLRATLDHDLGSFLGRRGRLDAAEAALDRAIVGFNATVPEAWGHAESLANRAVIDAIRGRLGPARTRLEDALARMERAAPGSLALASQQANVSIVLRRMGEPGAARELAEAALAIRLRLAPGSDLVAQTLNNLGVLAKNRGDLVAAQAYYQRALAIRESLDAPPLARASVLGNLANLAVERLDPDESLARHREVLALLEPVAPRHRFVVNTRLSLGQGEMLRGRFDEAETHLEAARALQETIGTEAPIYAAILEALGRLARERGRTTAAREQLDQALALRRRLDPGSLDAASVMLGLAELDRAGGDRDSALAGFEAAARLAAARAPGSLTEARARHASAGLLWHARDRDAALAADAAAMDAFERQRDRIGGDWLQRMRFGASQRALYVDAIERRLSAGRPAEAFAMAERYRAYERRRLLAGRVPLPALDDAARGLDRLSASLSPQEAVLAWIVGERSTYAFLLTADGLEARTLSAGEVDLREQVDALGVLLGVARPTPGQREALADRARRLHSQLIGPWEAALAPIRRLVLVPDQVLHRLPFAVLIDDERDAFLVERHALVYAASATLYASSFDRGAASTEVVAIGDPVAGPAGLQSGGGSRGAPGGTPGDRLPAARVEVDAIADLFPGRTLRLVGPAATEARVRDALPGAGLLHFAAHAVVDGARPLDAYVQLAQVPDSSHDGRLAAWEVLSQLSLDAELVTLSACRTARGRTLGGDGVLGLSQAFQLAGADAVLATLWDVPDEATAVLMQVFYTQLSGGHDAASALRTAQLDALARQRARSEPGVWSRLGGWLRRDSRRQNGPFEWAAFKLDGRPAPPTD